VGIAAMTIGSAFEAFRKALEIDAGTVADAIDLHEAATAGLKSRLEGHVRSFLSGSYGRRTRLEPLNDIDIVVIVEDTEPWDGDPETAMRAAGEAVRPDFPGCRITYGAHAAKVHPKDPAIDDVHLDIVIATETGDGTILAISEREPVPTWKKSDPEAHAAALTKANDKWSERLVPLIKQIKHWNRNNPGEPLESFLVEALTLRIFTGSGDVTPAEMIQKFFAEAKNAILTATVNPAVPEGFVDGGMGWNEREAHSDRLTRASRVADEAIEAAKSDEGAAQDIWYRLFGDPFPKPDPADRKATIAEALRTASAGVGGGTIITRGGRPTVPGRSFGAEEG
jgi:Second Messenger Oligonucleotide or Dinucleotide Synthetase domain